MAYVLCKYSIRSLVVLFINHTDWHDRFDLMKLGEIIDPEVSLSTEIPEGDAISIG